MNYYLSSFGLHNPYLVESTLPEHAIFPVASESREGLDLDYGSLLIGQKYIMDLDVYEYITNGGASFLASMANSLAVLNREGLLQLVDAGQFARQFEAKIKAKVELLCEDYTGWLEVVRSQWRELKIDRMEFQNSFGDPHRLAENTTHFTVLNLLRKRGLVDSKEELKRLTKLVEGKKRHFTRSEVEDIKELIRPLVFHMVAHDLYRTQTDSTVLDWDDGLPYYERLYSTRWDASAKDLSLQQGANRLFNISIPELKPDSVEEVISFIRNKKAVVSLRSELWRALDSQEPLDRKWVNAYLLEVVGSGLSKDKVMKRVRFGASALGLLLPGASLAAELATEAGVTASLAGVEKSISSDRFSWLFALTS